MKQHMTLTCLGLILSAVISSHVQANIHNNFHLSRVNSLVVTDRPLIQSVRPAHLPPTIEDTERTLDEDIVERPEPTE